MENTVRSYCIALVFWLTVFWWLRIAESAYVGASAPSSEVDRSGSTEDDIIVRNDALVQGWLSVIVVNLVISLNSSLVLVNC